MTVTVMDVGSYQRAPRFQFWIRKTEDAMELPKWAFKMESRVRRDGGAMELLVTLRPLGRLWLYLCAIYDLIRTASITITIELIGPRPMVTHEGQVIEPNLEYTLEDKEVEDLVKRVPIAKLPFLVQLAKDRHLFATTPERRASDRV